MVSLKSLSLIVMDISRLSMAIHELRVSTLKGSYIRQSKEMSIIVSIDIVISIKIYIRSIITSMKKVNHNMNKKYLTSYLPISKITSQDQQHHQQRICSNSLYLMRSIMPIKRCSRGHLNNVVLIVQV